MTLTATSRGATEAPRAFAGVTFKAPRKAVKVLYAGEPSKVEPLLQGYGEAFARSWEAGRSVSFRVDVDPDGRTTVTPVEGPTPARSGRSPTDASSDRNPELGPALAAARERGRARTAEILSGEDMLSAEAMALRLGISRVTVNTKRQNGQLLGLKGVKRGFRFPVWQLDAEERPWPELPSLHDILGGPWAVFRFLVQPHGELDGLTGLEALKRGRTKALLSAAESVARGAFR